MGQLWRHPQKILTIHNWFIHFKDETNPRNVDNEHYSLDEPSKNNTIAGNLRRQNNT